jgi:hypothetical protein
VAMRSGLYVYEAWVMTSKDNSRLQAAEIWFLRSVITITRWDKIKNGNIINKPHGGSLNNRK